MDAAPTPRPSVGGTLAGGHGAEKPSAPSRHWCAGGRLGCRMTDPEGRRSRRGRDRGHRGGAGMAGFADAFPSVATLATVVPGHSGGGPARACGSEHGGGVGRDSLDPGLAGVGGARVAGLPDSFAAVTSLPKIGSRAGDLRQILGRGNSRGRSRFARIAACGGDSRSPNSRFGGPGPAPMCQPAWANGLEEIWDASPASGRAHTRTRCVRIPGNRGGDRGGARRACENFFPGRGCPSSARAASPVGNCKFASRFGKSGSVLFCFHGVENGIRACGRGVGEDKVRGRSDGGRGAGGQKGRQE